MKWRCALIQRWLPAYPDGDLPSFWRERVRSHLNRCPACREELAGFEEVVRTIKAAPPPEPEPEFWDNFNRELHLKLAQTVPAPAPPGFFRKPVFLLGAPALAALLIWVAVGYLNPGRPGPAPLAPMAKQEQVGEKKPLASRAPAPAPDDRGSVVFVAQNGEGMPLEDDLADLRGDLDSTLADMTEKEKETFLKKLRQHEKDGSWLRQCSAIFWA